MKHRAVMERERLRLCRLASRAGLSRSEVKRMARDVERMFVQACALGCDPESIELHFWMDERGVGRLECNGFDAPPPLH